MIKYALRAGVAELVDAPDSKSGGGDIVWVQVPSPVLSLIKLKARVYAGFGLFSFSGQVWRNGCTHVYPLNCFCVS